MPVHPLSLAATALLLLSINACSQNAGPTLSAPDAYAQAQAGALTLVDIRRPDEWRQTGVARGALQINMVHPQGTPGFVQALARVTGGDKDAPIALICRTGNRTRYMQQELLKAGYTQVYNVDEGMAGSDAGPGWLARGLPLDACQRC